ncbi:hypothetical protein ACHAWF_014121, partial [Thalassiosira exigua]
KTTRATRTRAPAAARATRRRRRRVPAAAAAAAAAAALPGAPAATEAAGGGTTRDTAATRACARKTTLRRRKRMTARRCGMNWYVSRKMTIVEGRNELFSNRDSFLAPAPPRRDSARQLRYPWPLISATTSA